MNALHRSSWAAPAMFDSGLQGEQKPAENVMIVQTFAKEQFTNTVIIRQKCDQVLKQESLTVLEELNCVVDLSVDVHGDDVVEVHIL